MYYVDGLNSHVFVTKLPTIPRKGDKIRIRDVARMFTVTEVVWDFTYDNFKIILDLVQD